MKAKITLVATFTYDMNPDWYPEECDGDYKKMLDIDIEHFKDDIRLLLDSAQNIGIKGELLD